MECLSPFSHNIIKRLCPFQRLACQKCFYWLIRLHKIYLLLNFVHIRRGFASWSSPSRFKKSSNVLYCIGIVQKKVRNKQADTQWHFTNASACIITPCYKIHIPVTSLHHRSIWWGIITLVFSPPQKKESQKQADTSKGASQMSAYLITPFIKFTPL